ncbi:cysteine proteinase [Microthyrium microscopicum]|uniref:ubiquitinyl hydrolase 1 n=1 Tax=Microthyrium microscopicum TaxID=703497 RepID=A0A6A6TXZ5_9PEZI|nr:cysteine proteinase [Microthyrium microscopicum]
MENTPKTPGKTPPRIISDLKLYDLAAPDSRNPFTQPPYSYDHDTFIVPKTPDVKRCNHRFSVKHNRTHLDDPENGYPTRPIRKTAGICQECRCHVEITLLTNGPIPERCPTDIAPLHHFVLAGPMREQGRQRIFTFVCTTCRASLELIYRPPRLDEPYFDLLTDPENLRNRYEEALRQDPERRSIVMQSGIKVLDALSSYLNESLNPTREDRIIPEENKRFMTSFGKDCESFLVWLGFRKVYIPNPDGSPSENKGWQLPNTPSKDIFTDGPGVLLEDVQEEITVRMRKYSEAERRMLRNPLDPPHLLDLRVQNVLDSEVYTKAPTTLRSFKFDSELDEYFAGLGATQDFSDKLLKFCFNKQIEADPDHSSYYFDCLKGISEKRGTDDLNIIVGTLASEGYVSQQDVVKAYRYLGFQQSEIPSLVDDQILGSFNSRLESSPRHQESELRDKLRMIGVSRGSPSLTSAAENDFKTPQQALKWLDPTFDGSVQISDDSIIALAASKQSDRPEQTDLCRKAVEILAQDRDSEFLRIWAREGSYPENSKEEQIAAAYRFFNINDRTSTVDLDVLQFYTYESEDPARNEEAMRHYAVLSNHILKPNAGKGESWDTPVGLENMGNTCYLNCLLQFLYAIRPLRELITDFDEYKLDTSDPSYVPKKLDTQVVSKNMTILSQTFVKELRLLFQEMASDPRSSVRPTWDLAKLALKGDPVSGPAMPLLEPQEEEETRPPMKEPSPPPRPPPVPPRPIIGPMNKNDAGKTSIWNNDESTRREAEQAAQQQDVSEAMDEVLLKLQCAIKDTVPTSDGGMTDKVNELFYGKCVWKFLDSKTEDNTEIFASINVSLISKPKTISAGLDQSFGIDELESEGKKVRRYRTITKPPPIFQIHLHRQDYDHNRGDSVVLKHHIQLEEVIYLDRFITSSNPELHKVRENSWELDARLAKMHARRNQLLATTIDMEKPELLDATWSFVSSQGDVLNTDDPTLVDDLRAEAEHVRLKARAVSARLDGLETRRAALFTPYTRHAYRLAAVFVHRGQGGAMGGHYWIYIYDFKVDKWRRYEDREVREVTDPQEEIFKEKDPELQGAPYFVVYVRDEVKDEVVDALCRIKPVEEEVDADTQMGGMSEDGGNVNGLSLLKSSEAEEGAMKA